MSAKAPTLSYADRVCGEAQGWIPDGTSLVPIIHEGKSMVLLLVEHVKHCMGFVMIAFTGRLIMPKGSKFCLTFDLCKSILQA